MFTGLSIEDICEAFADAMGIGLFLSVIYMGCYLLRSYFLLR